MKLFLFYAFLITSFSLFSQTDISTHSEKVSGRVMCLGNDADGNVYSLITNKKKIVEVRDNSGNLKTEKALPSKIDKKKVFYKQMVCLNSKVVLIWLSDTGKEVLVGALELDNNLNELGSKELYKVPYTKKNQGISISLWMEAGTSENKEYFYTVIGAGFMNNLLTDYQYNVFDSSLNEIDQMTLKGGKTMPPSDPRYRLSDNGNLFVICLRAIYSSSNGDMKAAYLAKVEGKEVVDYDIYLNEGKCHVAGITKRYERDESDKRVIKLGAFSGEFDESLKINNVSMGKLKDETYSIEHAEYLPRFPNEEDRKSKSINYIVNDKFPFKVGYVSFNSEDNSYIIVAERFCRNSSLAPKFCTQDELVSTTHLSLMAIKLKSEGVIEWEHNIPKHMFYNHSSLHPRFQYFSYSPNYLVTEVKGELQLIFNNSHLNYNESGNFNKTDLNSLYSKASINLTHFRIIHNGIALKNLSLATATISIEDGDMTNKLLPRDQHLESRFQFDPMLIDGERSFFYFTKKGGTMLGKIKL